MYENSAFKPRELLSATTDGREDVWINELIVGLVADSCWLGGSKTVVDSMDSGTLCWGERQINTISKLL